MIEPFEGYRYFYIDGELHGPYRIVFDYDPDTLPPKAKYVPAHYAEPYRPIRGFRETLPREKAKVRVDGPVAQLWLPIPDNSWAARAFVEYYEELASRHRRYMETAERRAADARKLTSGTVITHPEMMKERRSDSYILHVP